MKKRYPVCTYLTDSRLWSILSFILLVWYLSPLFLQTFYVPIFDNLDSTVVWYKILAHSGQIFAPNNAIIPNMMNGLPRSSYGSEFDIILWLYYFFEPKTAFIINEILIHVVAFFSMFVFLKRYIVTPNSYYNDVPVYVGSLYFALLPFWSGAGLSIPLLPLVTYSLLNIKNRTDTKWDWIFLILLPLYTSFIFLYVFYIALGGLYWLYDALRNRSIDKRLLLALFLMGMLFLLKEYRLVEAMFFDQRFVSHRIEFDIFFKENLWECYRLSLVNFLLGHKPHAQTLQEHFLLPIALIALLLTFVPRRFTKKESIFIWVAIILSFPAGLWNTVLIHKFTLPGVILLSIVVWLRYPRYKRLPLLLLLVITLSLTGALFEYKGLHWLAESFPILRSFNMIRVIFVEPLIYVSILTLAIVIFFRKLPLTIYMVIVLIALQFHLSLKESFYQSMPKKGYDTFETYYVPDLFVQLEKQLQHKVKNFSKEKVHIISYGMEPAVALYNGWHTVDGYSTNYPLSYKHAFQNIFSKYKKSHYFDVWGSKLYIISVLTEKRYYQKGLKIQNVQFYAKALCRLKTDYVLSPYLFDDPKLKDRLILESNVTSKSPKKWDLYLYNLNCSQVK